MQSRDPLGSGSKQRVLSRTLCQTSSRDKNFLGEHHPRGISTGVHFKWVVSAYLNLSMASVCAILKDKSPAGLCLLEQEAQGGPQP